MKDERGDGVEGIPDVHPFAHLEKMSVLLEGRAFSDSGFVRLHPKRCCQHLTKLLWFFAQGDPVVGPEAQDVFFGVTKLFQSPDGNLRRLVYLFLRAAAEGGADATNLIIVTQSLVKDMFNETALYRGNALRVLGSIVDPSMLGQLERYFKQMIVDKDGYVASAALTTSLRLLGKPGAADTIGRWASEVHTVLTTRSGSDMTQFHALALLRAIKRHDRLAVSKVVGTLMKGGVRSPLALCLLIRYATSLHAADAAAVHAPALVDFLESCLTHRSEMVLLEAARALVALPSASASAGGRDSLGAAVRTLHVFLSSPRGALRFAAVRTLHALAGSHPAAVARCSDELEGLISDPNRAVATLAITTLLKTGGSDAAAGGGGGTASASLDRLIKQIGGFLSDGSGSSGGGSSSDELKIAVVAAIHDLALRVPSKHRSLMAFLANALREEGGFEFKRAVLDALLDIVEAIPEAAPEGLLHLCEFIEDCEYTSLASRVLHTLGDRGPASPQPAQFIRYIHNRVILEAPPVRASAVTALAKFASRVPELRPSIVPLLARCVDDDDDEVRDRAALFLAMLGGSLPAPPAPATPSAAGAGASAGAGAAPADAAASGAASGEAAAAAASSASSSSSAGAGAGAGLLPFEASLCRSMVGGRLPLPIAALTKALTLYAMRPGTGAFSFDALPHVEVPPAALAAAAASGASAGGAAASAPDAAGAGGAGGAGAAGFGFASEVRAAEIAAAAAKVARARARAADAAAAAASAGGIGSAGAAAPGAAGDAAGAGGAGGAGAAAAGAAAGSASGSASADALYRIPEFASFGPLFRSCRPVPLTEAEVEYTVSVTKHVFEKHVVLQFALANTLPEVLLERAGVAVSVSDAALYAPVVSIAAPKVRSGAPATCYVALARNPDAPLTAVTVTAELRFASRECDPATGEPLSEPSPETYPVDGFDISPADYVAPTPIADFRGAWDASGTAGEVIESYQLPLRSVERAVASIADALGMAFCDGTGTVRPGATRHAAFLSGTFLGGVRVLARMQVQLAGAEGADAAAAGASGVIVKVGVRSEDRDVSQLLMECIS